MMRTDSWLGHRAPMMAVVLMGWLSAAACAGDAPASIAAPNASTDAPQQPSVMMLPSKAAGSGGVVADSAAAGSSGSPDARGAMGAAGLQGAGGVLSTGRPPAAMAATAVGGSAAAGSTAAGSGGAGAAAAGRDAAMASCPAKNSYNAGSNSVTIMHGGRSRHFSVHVPSSVKAGIAVPLVLDFHGNGSRGSQQESSSGWRAKADSEAFLAAYPDGVGNGWNVGNCCGESLMSMVDDVGFAREVVKTISTNMCIDAKRVYATGLSNGAGMAHRLACEAADVFAAIAAASADLVTDPCTPARAISELSVRGLSDTAVAYEGGNTGSTGWYSPGAKGTLMLWKDINGCTGEPDTSKQYCETYTQCQGGVEVTLCSLPNTGHILYENSLGYNVPDEAWAMFMRQPMK
jgi:polyhydroxybutyrate depolymerase